MIITTTEDIAGRQIMQVIGLVSGNTIRAKNVFKDIGASVKWLVGGEIKSYAKMMTDARNEALKRMINEAENLGADAVIGVRFSTFSILDGAAEILCYGTAVKLR